MVATCSDPSTVGESSTNVVDAVPIATDAQYASPSTTGTLQSKCVDLNTASKEELQRIVHIGSSRADGIIAIRPLYSVRGIDKVSGIGTSRIDDILSQGLACIQ